MRCKRGNLKLDEANEEVRHNAGREIKYVMMMQQADSLEGRSPYGSSEEWTRAQNARTVRREKRFVRSLYSILGHFSFSPSSHLKYKSSAMGDLRTAGSSAG